MGAMIDDSWYTRPEGVRDRTSAGGVIARLEGDAVLVGLVREADFSGYILPKGGVEPGEDAETAAMREIGEEAGISDLRLIAPLGIRARLSFDRRRWTTTYYFLFTTHQEVGRPTDTEKVYRLEWFPLHRLPPLFWPEQAELVASHVAEIERLVQQSAG
jgi:8-oxo-dGTP pyrophosphatase MutT (NUDIX family)